MLFLAVFMGCLVPQIVFAESAEDYNVLAANFNKGAVQDCPEEDCVLDFAQPTRLDAITTYHWNGGRGASPGSIYIFDADTHDLVFEFEARGRVGSGVENAYWECFPHEVLPAGTYEFADSDRLTWSYNDASVCGMIEIRGAVVSGFNGGEASKTETEKTKPEVEPQQRSSQKYYFSDWAKGDIERASSLDIIPEFFLGEDLRESINRQEFAAVAVKAYEKMSGVTLSVGSNPFNDTSDTYVLKAANGDIVAGTGANTFSPYNGLTREQAATMLTRAYKKTVFNGWSLKNDYALEYTAGGRFSDHDNIRPYAREAVEYLSLKGVINGMGNNMFVPEGTLTKEQALAIAVRMTEKLDMTKKEGKMPVTEAQTQATTQAISVGGAVEAEASGEVSNGKCSVTFVTGNKGKAHLSEVKGYSDGSELSDTYNLALTEAPEGEVTISIDSKEPPVGQIPLIRIGSPYTAENGEEGIAWNSVEATYSNGKTKAQLSLEQFGSAMVEDTYFAGSTARLKSRAPIVAKKLAVGNYAEDYIFFVTYGKTYELKGDHHFKLIVPASVSEGTMLKMTDGEYELFLKDCENAYNAYVSKKFEIKRTRWPMTIEAAASLMGGADGCCSAKPNYNYAVITLNFGSVIDYKGRTDQFGYGLSKTFAHELCHFVQKNYINGAMGTLWVDEFVACFYEQELQKDIGKYYDLTGNPVITNFMYQYSGVVPSYLPIPVVGSGDAHGYARVSFGSYLYKYYGGDEFYRKLYGDYNYIDDECFTQLTKKSLAELAKDFYVKLMTDEELLRRYASLWDLREPDANIEEMIKKYRKKLFITPSNDGITKNVIVSPYGVYLMPLDFTGMTANYTSFDITSSSTAIEPILFEYCEDGNFDKIKVIAPSNGSKSLSSPLNGRRYFLMLISSSSSALDTTVTIEAHKGMVSKNNYGTVNMKGTLTYVENSNKTSVETSADARVTLTTDNTGSFTLAYNGMTISEENMQYDPSTGVMKGNVYTVYLNMSGGSISSDEEDVLSAFTQDGAGNYVRIACFEKDYLFAFSANSSTGGINVTSVSNEKAETTVSSLDQTADS